MEHELAVARRIQTGLFPTILPTTPQLEVRAHNEPGRQVSGDYYDVVPMEDGRTAVIVADVSGKGVSAALLMANLQAAVRVTLPAARDAATVVRQWNRLLYANTDASQFVTMLLAIVDLQAPRIEIVNAGHMMPICIRPDGTLFEPPESGSLPLGVEPEEPYYAQYIERVGAPNTLLLYTDGVTEAIDEQQQFFGAERLREVLAGRGGPPAGDVIDATRLRLRKFCGRAPLADDVTLVAVQMR
jgi:sigma-B regulation protein RsbU (phosphoserine phosphatase)